MEFPRISLADWRARVEKELAGKSFEKTLVQETIEASRSRRSTRRRRRALSSREICERSPSASPCATSSTRAPKSWWSTSRGRRVRVAEPRRSARSGVGAGRSRAHVLRLRHQPSLHRGGHRACGGAASGGDQAKLCFEPRSARSLCAWTLGVGGAPGGACDPRAHRTPPGGSIPGRDRGDGLDAPVSRRGSRRRGRAGHRALHRRALPRRAAGVGPHARSGSAPDRGADLRGPGQLPRALQGPRAPDLLAKAPRRRRRARRSPNTGARGLLVADAHGAGSLGQHAARHHADVLGGAGRRGPGDAQRVRSGAGAGVGARSSRRAQHRARPPRRELSGRWPIRPAARTTSRRSPTPWLARRGDVFA